MPVLGPEWQTSNTALAYPFIGRILDPPDLHTLFADAAISCGSSGMQEGDRLFLHALNILGQTVEIRNQDDETFFVGTAPASKVSVFGQWRILEWSGDGVSVRFLLDDGAVPSFPGDLSPADAEFCARVVQRGAARVERIHVDGDWRRGEIRLVEGYNTRIERLEDKKSGGRVSRRIQISSMPGSGLGRYVSCDPPERVIRSVAGVRGDKDGKFHFEGDGCYFFTPVLTPAGIKDGRVYYTTGNRLQINNVCSQCCSCDDFVQAYEIIRDLFNQARSLGTFVGQIKDEYEAAVGIMEAEKTLREGISCFMYVTAIHGFCMDIKTYIVNSTENDIACSSEDPPDNALVWTFTVQGSLEIDLPAQFPIVFTDASRWLCKNSDTTVSNAPSHKVSLAISQTLRPTRVMAVSFRVFMGKVNPGETVTVGFAGQAGGQALSDSKSANVLDYYTPP